MVGFVLREAIRKPSQALQGGDLGLDSLTCEETEKITARPASESAPSGQLVKVCTQCPAVLLSLSPSRTISGP